MSYHGEWDQGFGFGFLMAIGVVLFALFIGWIVFCGAGIEHDIGWEQKACVTVENTVLQGNFYVTSRERRCITGRELAGLTKGKP